MDDSSILDDTQLELQQAIASRKKVELQIKQERAEREEVQFMLESSQSEVKAMQRKLDRAAEEQARIQEEFEARVQRLQREKCLWEQELSECRQQSLARQAQSERDVREAREALALSKSREDQLREQIAAQEELCQGDLTVNVEAHIAAARLATGPTQNTANVEETHKEIQQLLRQLLESNGACIRHSDP